MGDNSEFHEFSYEWWIAGLKAQYTNLVLHGEIRYILDLENVLTKIVGDDTILEWKELALSYLTPEGRSVRIPELQGSRGIGAQKTEDVTDQKPSAPVFGQLLIDQPKPKRSRRKK